MDYRPAEFVRFVDRREDLDELVDEAKADTWRLRQEHAVFILADQRTVLVRGGKDGISCEDRGDEGIFIELDGDWCRVERISWHTHPEPTGPSDHDCSFLSRLGQESSVIYELKGEVAGTRFWPK